jgi:stalled ribosome alternative rescue factor ArfA
MPLAFLNCMTQYKITTKTVCVRLLLKSSTLWDTKPCRPLRVNWRYVGTLRLHLQGLRKNQERNERGRGCRQRTLKNLHTGIIFKERDYIRVFKFSSTLWDTRPRRPLRVNSRYIGTLRLHLQGLRKNQERNERGRGCRQRTLKNLHIGIIFKEIDYIRVLSSF